MLIDIVSSANRIRVNPNKPPISVVVLGDSTLAAYLDQHTVASFVFTASEVTAGFSATSLAVPGNTINQQKAVWDAYADKLLHDVIIVQVGLNDITAANTVSVNAPKMQALINDINSTKKTGAKIIISCMDPCKQRWIDLQGATLGATAQQNWTDLNQSYMGGGSFAITGVDYRINLHIALLDDGSGNLKTEYEAATPVDHIHPNDIARKLNGFNSHRVAIRALGYL